MTIAEKIQDLRIGRGLTQERLAEMLEAYPTYHYFHMRDPDNNVIEITGTYTQQEGEKE